MNVNLGNVLDNFVADLLKTGLYQSQSEVVREGLRLLKEREELKGLRLAELRREIAIGSEQADRGEFVDGEEAIAEIRARSAGRKRARGRLGSFLLSAPGKILATSGTILPRTISTRRIGYSMR